MGLLLNHVVDSRVVSVEIRIVALLLFARDLLAHSALPSLGDHLSLDHLTFLRKLGALLNGISREDAEVCILLQSVSVVADILLVTDDTHTLAAVQCLIGNLGLEREAFDFCEINIFHLYELFDGLKSVFKCDLGLLSNVTELTRHKRLVL
jgi:hypothetical protein